MESSTPVYDSITGGALRMARRHWYVIVAIAALAVVAGLLRTGRASTYTAEGTVEIMLDHVTTPGAKPDPDNPTVDPISLARRVASAKDDTTIPESVGVTVTGDQTAGSLLISVTADSEKSAADSFAAMADQATTITVAEATGRVRSRISALEQLVKANDTRVAQLDDQIAAANSSGTSLGPSSPLVLQRATAADNAASAQRDLLMAQSQLDALSNNLVSTSTPTIEPSESSTFLPLAAGLAGAVIAFGVLMVLQAVDGRIRRRIQIERDVPHARMLGVVAKNTPAAQVAVLQRSLGHLIADTHVSQVLLVDLKGRTAQELATALSKPADVEIRAVEADAAVGSYGVESTAVVFVVPFGSVPQQVLQAAVADARTAGSTNLGAILTDVPTADHAWAAVSID